MDPKNNQSEEFFELRADIKILAGAVSELKDAIKEFRDDSIKPIQIELKELQKWRQQIDGGYKVAGILISILTIITFIMSIFGHK